MKFNIYQKYLMLILIVVIVVYTLILTLFPISMDRTYMPTFVNGITTSISIITGLGGAIIGIVFRSDIEKGDSKARTSYFMAFSLLIAPLLYPWGAYIALATNQFEFAVRYSLNGYLVALLVLIAVYLLTAGTWFRVQDSLDKTDSASPEPIKTERTVEKQTEKSDEKANKISTAGLVLTLLIALMINVPFAIWNWQQNNRAIDIANQNLALTNMINNFNCDISASQSFGTFYSYGFFSVNGTIESIDGNGELNISLKIVTPHYAHVTILVENFSEIFSQNWINREMANRTSVSYTFEEPYEDTIGSGLTQMNATLQLKATIYPDPQQLPIESGNWTRFYLGPLLLEAQLYDIQTQKYFTKDFIEPMNFQITMP